MNRSIKQKFKKNIIVLTLMITIVFVVINMSLFTINNNYLINKVKEENAAFLEITTHIIDDNDVAVALVYVEHYTHIHKVDIKVLDEDLNVLFNSDINQIYVGQHSIDTLKGTYIILIDNKDSATVSAIEKNTVYVNVLLLFIYLLTMLILLRNNNVSSRQIDQDIKNVLKLIDSEKKDDKSFNHLEFEHIHKKITMYLENIDLLTEQKEMNMKGLAHDIKTPLTVVYHYFDSVLNNKKISEKETKKSFEAAVRINELLNGIIGDKQKQVDKALNISKILNEKIEEYTPIFDNKKISIVKNIESYISLNWSDQDFARVIDNIISNAYYYSEQGSVFEVNAIKAESISIEFISKPKNLKDVDIDQMFKKGSRGLLSHKDNSYGKGYGLYLCRLLLESINGSININIIDGHVKVTIIL